MNWESKYSLLKLRNKEAKNSSGNECAEKDNQMTLMLNLRGIYSTLTLGSTTPYKISARILMMIKKVAATNTEPMTTG